MKMNSETSIIENLKPDSQEVRDFLDHYQIELQHNNCNFEFHGKTYNYRIRLYAPLKKHNWNYAYNYWDRYHNAMILKRQEIKKYALNNNDYFSYRNNISYYYTNMPSIQRIEKVINMLTIAHKNLKEMSIPINGIDPNKNIHIQLHYYPDNIIANTKHRIIFRKRSFPFNCRFEIKINAYDIYTRHAGIMASIKNFASMNQCFLSDNTYFGSNKIHINNEDVLDMFKFKYIKYISKINEYRMKYD